MDRIVVEVAELEERIGAAVAAVSWLLVIFAAVEGILADRTHGFAVLAQPALLATFADPWAPFVLAVGAYPLAAVAVV